MEHVAGPQRIAGPSTGSDDVLGRVHSECLTGVCWVTPLRLREPQLDAALAMVARGGRGVVLYMRGHEDRGIG